MNFKNRMFFLFSVVTLCGGIISTTGCLSTNHAEPKPDEKPPAITQDMDTNDAVEAALKFGGDTLIQVKQLIGKRKGWDAVKNQMVLLVSKSHASLPEARLINAINLYQSSTDRTDPQIFEALVRSDREISRILAWNLAANIPSKEIAQAMDQEFTRRIKANQEDILLVPQMAQAVQANRLTSAYTIVRLGLMKNGDDAFAKAMIALAPQQVSEDFMTYLGKASVEELRQMNQTTINLFSCMLILKFFTSNRVPLTHPDFPTLFLYSVSRNQSLADLAGMVIDKLIAENRNVMAITLARMPAWVQVAYIENSRQRKAPQLVQFLTDLQDLTIYDEVSEEISEPY